MDRETFTKTEFCNTISSKKNHEKILLFPKEKKSRISLNNISVSNAVASNNGKYKWCCFAFRLLAN